MAFVRQLVFDLSYHQLGGGGLGWGREETLRTPISEALDARKRLSQAKQQDVKASEKAAEEAAEKARRGRS
jgi:hypothetical protein